MLRRIYLLLILLTLFPGVIFAQAIPVTQGGTGWGFPGGIQSGKILFGNGTSKLGTSTSLLWDNTLNKLTATNASTSEITTSGQASTSQLRVSNSATFNFLGTGLAKLTSGVLGLATAGVDYLASYDAFTHPSAGVSATTTEVRVGGLVSTASSTISGDLTVTGVATSSSFNTTSTSATSTFAYGLNVLKGCIAINGTCLSTGAGSGTVTSVGASGPTGLTWSSAVTTSGTLTATLNSGFSLRKLPSYVVAASGGDFTTIQGALDACGASGGGNIALTDTSYTQGGTGLLFKGSNCHLSGRGIGTTTISFTGATTGIKTNSAASLYENNSVEGVIMTADGNTSGICIDESDMSHTVYQNIHCDNWGSLIRVNDTQNITFYNITKNIVGTTLTVFGINASSTNPTNFNEYSNIFAGCSAANCVAYQFNNGNGNKLYLISAEPSTNSGTVGLKLFDNTLATNDGFWGNEINGCDIEANGTGVNIANSSNPSGGGIQRNVIQNCLSVENTTDWTVGSNSISQNSFISNTDSNYGAPITSFQGPLGVGTSTRLANINNTPWAFFGINPTAGVASNQFAVGSSTATSFIINNSGKVGVSSTTPNYLLSLNSGASAFSVDTGGVATTSIINTVSTTINSIIQKAKFVLSLTLPTGTAPTFTNVGDIAWDTTSGNLRVATSTAGATVAVGGATTTLYSYTASTTALVSGSTIGLPAHFLPQVAIAIICRVTSGTSFVINLSNEAGSSDTNAVTCTTTTTQFALTTNNSFAAYAGARIEFGSKVGDVGDITLRVVGYRLSD